MRGISLSTLRACRSTLGRIAFLHYSVNYKKNNMLMFLRLVIEARLWIRIRMDLHSICGSGSRMKNYFKKLKKHKDIGNNYNFIQILKLN